MSQLVQASRKGSPSQQILARKLLAAAFSKEKEMLGLLVAGLRSEFSEVRSATLLLLPDLPFDAQTLASCRNILEDGLTDRSRTSRVKCKISEWIGIGSVGGSYGEQSEIAVALILLCKFDKKDGNYLSKLIDRLSPHVLETAIDALNRSEDGLLQITTEPQVVLQKLINKASLIALGPAVFEKLAMLAEPYRNSKERSLFRCWLRLWKP